MKKAVILNDTSFESHHGCETVVKNIKALLLQNGIQTIDTHPVGKPWVENKSFIANMSQADIVIVNGEGTLHHSQPRAKDLISVGQYVKENLNIPVVLINSTCQDNNNDIIESMKCYDLIFVRESLSQKELAQYDIESTVVPDMSFYSKYNLSNKEVTGGVGITDSVYFDLSETLFDLSLKEGYEFLPAKTNSKIRKHTFYALFKYAKSNLFKAVRYPFYKLNLIKFKYKKIRKFYYINDYDSYVNKIASSKFMIIARYHSLCFSLKTVTPFLALKSNSHKIEGILSDVGIESSRIVTASDIASTEFREFTSEEEANILHYINEAPKKIKGMFIEINSLIEK